MCDTSQTRKIRHCKARNLVLVYGEIGEIGEIGDGLDTDGWIRHRTASYRTYI